MSGAQDWCTRVEVHKIGARVWSDAREVHKYEWCTRLVHESRGARDWCKSTE